MISLKLFLDSMAEEGHPFRKGPDLREGSAVPVEDSRVPSGMPGERTMWAEQLVRFFYMRLNKN